MRRRFFVFNFPLIALIAVGLTVPAIASGAGQIEGAPEGLGDVDNRAGKIPPTSAQLARVTQLGATARFNQFGTVQSLIKYGGYLATGLTGTPAQAARSFVDQNRVLFRLSPAGVNNLEVLTDAGLPDGAGQVVVFRQKFGGSPSLLDGVISVGVRDGNVYYASSTSAGEGNAPTPAAVSPQEAWVAAATNVGIPISVVQIKSSRNEGGWTVMQVSGFQQAQRARVGAVPTPSAGVVPGYETIVLADGVAKDGHVHHGAYKHMIDARNGQVLYRQNLDMHAAQADAEPFDGTLVPGCSPKHGPYHVGPNTKSIDVVATADNPVNDITIELYHESTHVAHGDTGTSPEALHYEPGGGVAEGDYFVEICMFESAAPLPPTTYHGAIVINDVLGVNPQPYPPQWKVFPASPLLAGQEGFPWNFPSTDIREVWCWEKVVGGQPVVGCDRELKNLAARVPWDYDPVANSATFTTEGNAASTSEAWTNPLGPGPFGFRPVAPDRKYIFPWANTWYQQGCSQTSLLWPNEPDLPAAVTNLFAMHNRMHDWSYFLGFTEQHWNAQKSNFGLPTAQGDPVLGQAQAGALLPVQVGLSRDNANMRPLPDGVSPITNMYLWQPIAGAFYAPCVDGDFDMPVIGHEYGHAIENRMIGKGGTRSGTQAGAMGESFGDFDAVEYLQEAGFVPVDGENPFSVGPYVTGDKDKGIRNFAMNWVSSGDEPRPSGVPKINPLQYGAVGYDFVCNAPLVGPPIEDPCPNRTQVHADGEIWSATQYDIRQALVSKYNAQFPASDKALQEKCGFGSFADDVDQCPGNRRWIQLYYDAMLLMPVGPSMLDARDAMLAADQNRFGGANQTELWRAFAKRGFGEFAVSDTNSDPDPKPNFESAVESNEATVTFSVVQAGNFTSIETASIFVGWYEAGVTPIADTNPATNEPVGENNLDTTAKFVPGRYEFIAQAPGYGHFRFRLTLAANENRNVVVTMPQNLASVTHGATAFGNGVNHVSLIDDTENTNWASLNSPLGVADDFVVVDLAGSNPVQVSRLQVSAMLRPADDQNTGDPAGQNRFTALRSFEIWTCSASPANANCATPPLGYTIKYTSPADFFPATAPRPVSPDLIIRTFQITKHPATHVMLKVLHNQCTGGPHFQGEQDQDLTTATDCETSANADDVRAAELQVFSRGGRAGAQPRDPGVILTKTGPPTAKVGDQITYTLSYTNAGPADAQNSKITDKLPSALRFVSASDNGTIRNGVVTWNLGTVPNGASGSVTLVARVRSTVAVGTSILNEAEFTGDLVVSPPLAKWVTLVVP
jgi:extracellular elastinolytic metalloproteinase